MHISRKMIESEQNMESVVKDHREVSSPGLLAEFESGLEKKG